MIQILKHFIYDAKRLNNRQHLALIDLLYKSPQKARSVLGGRGSVAIHDLNGVGPVAIKHFTRGGWLGFLVSHYYLKFGSTRSQVEYEMLETVKALGVSVPEPLAYIYRGRFFYRAWLVTKAIENHRTLAELISEDRDRAENVVQQLVSHVETLIKNKIFHIDLHPGNVLVDEENKVYLIDFDKAHAYSGQANDLRDKYLCRWRRAVIKHELAEVLSELMCAGLRKNFNGC